MLVYRTHRFRFVIAVLSMLALFVAVTTMWGHTTPADAAQRGTPRQAAPSLAAAQAPPCIDGAALKAALRPVVQQMPFYGQSNDARNTGSPNANPEGLINGGYRVEKADAGGAGMFPITFSPTPDQVQFDVIFHVNEVKTPACWTAAEQEREFRMAESRWCPQPRSVQPFGPNSCVSTDKYIQPSEYTGKATVLAVHRCARVEVAHRIDVNPNDSDRTAVDSSGRLSNNSLLDPLESSAEKWTIEVTKLLLDTIERECVARPASSATPSATPRTTPSSSPRPTATPTPRPPASASPTPRPPGGSTEARIFVDRPSYRVGDPITMCVEVPSSGDVVVVDTLADGTEVVVFGGFISSTFCLEGTITEPTGTECLSLVYDGSIGGIVRRNTDATCFQVMPRDAGTPRGGNWGGTWETSYGTMRLTVSGSSVTGTYDYRGGRITGTISGNRLVGTWSQEPSFAPPSDAGDVEFTLSGDGRSFTGRWRYGSTGEWANDWDGTRAGR